MAGRLLCRRGIRARAEGRQSPLPAAAGLVQAVASGTGGMLSICAFVLVFSAVAQVLEDGGLLALFGGWLSGITGGLLTPQGAACFGIGLLEIGGGCARAQQLPPGQGALVLPFLLSFSSCSVICQLGACFGERPAKLRQLLRARVVHGLLTAALATPVLWGRFASAPAMTGQPVLAPGNGGLLGALFMAGMCGILASAIGEGEG